MSLTAAKIGLATPAVSPVWMRHGRRGERVLKQSHKQQSSQLVPGEFGRAARIADF